MGKAESQSKFLSKTQLDTIETTVNTIETNTDTIETKVDTIETKVDGVGTDLDNLEVSLRFPSADALDDIAAVGPTNTTELPITVVLPLGATIRRVMLAAFITVMNDTATAQKIDIDVQGRIAAGAWNTYFSQNAVLGFPAVDGATTGTVCLQDVSALVTVAGTFGFRLQVTQTAANSVHYTTQFLLLVTYRMQP